MLKMWNIPIVMINIHDFVTSLVPRLSNDAFTLLESLGISLTRRALVEVRQVCEHNAKSNVDGAFMPRSYLPDLMHEI